MPKLAYVNGRFLPQGQAGVSIEDRGFQLSDGVYEVWAVFDGKLVDAQGHFARLERSLGELMITPPMSQAALTTVLRETVRRNRIVNGTVYLQITRGAAPRDHAFPTPAPRPTMVVTARKTDLAVAEARAAAGVKVITLPDIRWGRCDIKTISLLPNVLARQSAKEQGAYEAFLVDQEGLVTEGAASNAWIVDADGILRTRDLGANILRGVTRRSLADLARKAGLTVEERAFTVTEAKGAREAFLTGAGSLIMPVVRIDDQNIADGRPGAVAKQLRALYIQHGRKSAI
ncbi:MAG TPA: D-amino-acid transaminase [Caulobacteraceae bacterium]|nr:D-amino-acid transaminase [Caulobacteraceae bacterium]